MTSQGQQWCTLVFMVAMATATIAYDIFVYRYWGVHATISRVCLCVFDAHPVVMVIAIFALGVVVGHLVLPQ